MALERSFLDNPTWQTPIRSFFNDIDINHMLQVTSSQPEPLDLRSYESVTSGTWRDAVAGRIASGSMPIPPSQPWSDEMKATFATWIGNGYPEQ